MKNITITAYDYNELTGQAKTRAYNTMYEAIIDCVNDCFYDDTKDDLCDRFCNSILDLQYDFSNCQGSGLNIYGDFDLRDYLPHYQASEKNNLRKQANKSNNNGARLRFYRNNRKQNKR